MKELDRLQLMTRIAERRLTRRRAAGLLNMSERQVRRLYRAFVRDGAADGAFGLAGRVPKGGDGGAVFIACGGLAKRSHETESWQPRAAAASLRVDTADAPSAADRARAVAMLSRRPGVRLVVGVEDFLS